MASLPIILLAGLDAAPCHSCCGACRYADGGRQVVYDCASSSFKRGRLLALVSSSGVRLLGTEEAIEVGFPFAQD